MDKPFKPYLIQRCESKKTGPITGFNSAFAIDYMGSSEFEQGALPKSLRRITPKLDQYQIYNTELKDHEGKGVFVICTPERKDQILALLPKLADGSHRLKETTRFGDMLKGKCSDWDQFHLWWDIEFDWFFCIGKPVAKLLLQALTALKARWDSEK